MADTLKLFLEISAMASVMIVIVLLIRRFLSKRMSPVVMLLLWGLVLLRLILPFTISSPVQLAELLPQKKRFNQYRQRSSSGGRSVVQRDSRRE